MGIQRHVGRWSVVSILVYYVIIAQISFKTIMINTYCHKFQTYFEFDVGYSSNSSTSLPSCILLTLSKRSKQPIRQKSRPLRYFLNLTEEH